MKEILIYTDRGACPQSITHLAATLNKLIPSNEVKQVKSKDLIESDWEEKTALIIMPGGRDIPYHNALTGKGNQKIRDFVNNGGRFLGICAGGYYGCAEIEFEKGNELEVLAKRELQFFPGLAAGPAYGNGKFRYHSEAGVRIAHLSLNQNKTVEAYYNGGCSFVDAEKYSCVQILGRYRDLPDCPAAIVKCCVGKGVAILSGVHPEYSVEGFMEKELFSYLLNCLEGK